MGCEVYANGNEIACKAGDNKVIAEFPDVCLSPPSPPAGPIPVPYPNTSFSKDMKNGSKKVKIKNKEVMLKDKSFYKTSPLGDEAATRSFGASVVTHVITGKTYFLAWSMDVKFEGLNVDRHLDLMTSNHASPMGSTPPTGPSTAKGTTSTTVPCAHEWDITPDSEIKYTAQQKKDRLRKGDSADKFEAKAADHNNVQDGNCMSGKNPKSKLYQYCTKCGERGNEVDHVTRDSSGKVTSTVEVKSGNCHIKPSQLKQAKEVAQQLGIPHKYKLEAGLGAQKAEKELLTQGIDAANIITI